MKIMVLNDGETYCNIQGCQIVELPDTYGDDDIEEILDILNKENDDVDGVTIIGGYNSDGEFILCDPRTPPDDI